MPTLALGARSRRRAIARRRRTERRPRSRHAALGRDAVGRPRRRADLDRHRRRRPRRGDDALPRPCQRSTARHAAGIMVSASHNPAPDNGLKVVVGGRKVDDAVEAELDALIDDPVDDSRPAERRSSGGSATDRDAVEAYLRHLRRDRRRRVRRAADRDRLRQRLGQRHRAGPVPLARRGGDRAVRRARTGRTSTTDAARPIRSAWPRRSPPPASSSASPSMATPIGSSRSTSAGELVDGDAVMGICALERLADGTLRNRRPGGDRHEQRRPRAGRASSRRHGSSGPRSEIATSSRRWSARTRCSAASSPATSSSATGRRPATAC